MPTTLIIYGVLLLAALASGAGFIAYQRHEAATAAVAKLEQQQEAAAKQAQDAIDAAVAAAADKITDMEAAYESGEANSKTITQKIYVQGQSYAANDKGLSNTQCVMAPDSLQLLRSALAGMRTPTDPGEVAPAVPGPSAAGGRIVQQPVPQQPQEHGPVGPVHEDARPTGNAGGVPGQSVPVGPRPKPKPIH